MRTGARLPICFCLVLICISAAPCAGAGRGKFYIVGMGTAPDLITMRGEILVRASTAPPPTR
jgi:hypothetical protein